VCAGGIIGLGEGEEDRVGLLLQLATLPEHPESVPINRLVAVKGTPLQVRGCCAVGYRHCCSNRACTHSLCASVMSRLDVACPLVALAASSLSSDMPGLTKHG
jgi:hypothetical protein